MPGFEQKCGKCQKSLPVDDNVRYLAQHPGCICFACYYDVSTRHYLNTVKLATGWTDEKIKQHCLQQVTSERSGSA
jgi:hypothetical protein